MPQVANVTFSSGECNSLEWEMYPLGNKMNSLEWRNEQSRVAKSTDSSGECYSLKWQMSQMPNVTFLSGECYNLEWQMYPLSSKCKVLNGECIL